MNAPTPGETLFRPRLLTLLHTALALNETRFTRRLALSWLASYPGDLPVNLINARALIAENRIPQAIEILELICQVDVEYLEAYELLALAYHNDRTHKKTELPGIIYALKGETPRGESVPGWAVHLRSARQASPIGYIDRAHDLIHRALLANSNCPLIAVTHLQVLAGHNISSEPSKNATDEQSDYFSRPNLSNILSIRSLAEAYHQQWPLCSQINLILAQALIDCNEDDAAVALIHQSAAQDVTGQVAARLWGNNHIYRNLWPDSLSIIHEQPIPAAIAASLGWNQLPGTIDNRGLNVIGTSSPMGATKHIFAKTPRKKLRDTDKQTSGSPSVPPQPMETLHSVQDELDKLASSLKQPFLAHNDGRFPVYVLFSTQTGLEHQYGATGAAAIDIEMKRLAQATLSTRPWDAIIYYADRGGYNVLPTKPTDPWGLKLALIDLDAALAKQGERIGAVLIIGGPQVVPFHHLPNPVDDADADVPSDNPYGTRDENYFIPEWPVGRLPGDATNDPAPLITALRAITNQCTKHKNSQSWLAQIWQTIKKLFHISPRFTRTCLGYTAAIWRRASLAVYRSVGDGHGLQISPPIEQVSGEQWDIGSLGYFNLHGVVDAADWFGQRDPTEPNDGPDYPVVLSPENIVNSGRSPQVVFSEACYGAHIINRSVDEALALKFLASGSQAVIGSTCTSYGSVTLPLIAADMLARYFWRFLNEAYPVGEALRRAKVALAREMHNRQGYLDGEDQKTLISFVLLGDPLAQPSGVPPHHAKTLLRSAAAPTQPLTVCDKNDPMVSPQPIPPETLAQVKSIVAQYLPGMSDAELSFTDEHINCEASGHTCPTASTGAKTHPGTQHTRKTIVLSKRYQQDHHYHNQYARLTLDEQGKLVKLALSR